MNVTDRQTDKETDRITLATPIALYTASHGKMNKQSNRRQNFTSGSLFAATYDDKVKQRIHWKFGLFQHDAHADIALSLIHI